MLDGRSVGEKVAFVLAIVFLAAGIVSVFVSAVIGSLPLAFFGVFMFVFFVACSLIDHQKH